MSYTLYPAALDTFTDKVDGVDDVLAADFNKLQDAMKAMEVQMGVTNSGDTNSFDYRLRDAVALGSNVNDVVNGAPGMPRIKTAAIDAGQVTNDKLQPPVAGDLYTIARFVGTNNGQVEVFGGSSYTSDESIVTGRVYRYINYEGESIGNYISAIGFNCLVSGSIRLYLESTNITTYRVLKNGVQIQSISTTSVNWTGRNLDINVSTGDNITLQFSSRLFRNIFVKSNNPNFAVT
jgi:hypothetical protein